jgi:pyruvate kinase
LETLNRLELIWGLQTLLIRPYSNLEQVVEQIEKILIQYGLAKTGDKVVMTYGQPIYDGTKTNTVYTFTLGGDQYTKLPDDQLPMRCQKEMII